MQRQGRTYDTTGKLSNRRLAKFVKPRMFSMKHLCVSTYTFSNHIIFFETFLTSSIQVCLLLKLHLLLIQATGELSLGPYQCRSFEHADRQPNSVTSSISCGKSCARAPLTNLSWYLETHWATLNRQHWPALQLFINYCRVIT